MSFQYFTLPQNTSGAANIPILTAKLTDSGTAASVIGPLTFTAVPES